MRLRGLFRSVRPKAQDCRTRFSSVPAKDHWLILGWGDKTLLLVDELQHSSIRQWRALVVS